MESNKKSSPIADYIQPTVDKKYRTRSDAANDIGIEESSLSRICSGQRARVSESIIEKVCDKLGLDKSEGVLRLFLTKNSKIRKYFNRPKKCLSFRVIHKDPNEINPKRLSEAYSPVPCVTIEELTKNTPMARKSSEYVLVPKELSPKVRNIKCIQIKGNSMGPGLPEGSIVAVDLDNRKPHHNSLLLLNWKKKIIVRRIFIKDKYLLLTPNNKDYDVEVCTIKKAKSIRDNPILGKILWSMGKI